MIRLWLGMFLIVAGIDIVADMLRDLDGEWRIMQAVLAAFMWALGASTLLDHLKGAK